MNEITYKKFKVGPLCGVWLTDLNYRTGGTAEAVVHGKPNAIIRLSVRALGFEENRSLLKKGFVLPIDPETNEVQKNNDNVNLISSEEIAAIVSTGEVEKVLDLLRKMEYQVPKNRLLLHVTENSELPAHIQAEMIAGIVKNLEDLELEIMIKPVTLSSDLGIDVRPPKAMA